MTARGQRRSTGARGRAARATSAGSARTRALAARPRAPVEHLRAICLALPEVTEKTAHGEPTWRVGGRMFASLDDHHHGADRLAVWLAAALGDQEALVTADPKRLFVPPYVGHRGWIGVRIDGRPDWRRVRTLVRDAYVQVAPRRLLPLTPEATVVREGRRTRP